jgi:hypothetical protein
MTNEQRVYLRGLIATEKSCNYPVFTWQGNNYVCISSSEINNLQLGNGGFENIESLSLTVRTINLDGTSIFSNSNNNYPQPQELISYNNSEFRIDKISQNVLGVSIRLICYSTTNGL